mmetsp:Transcript_33082/g.98405  ORF Transcript_33082/g.98405 Transcript_33082/m.98405 type:complete len:280 (-) Transcript_33082:288-1127(-)|eukprot:CAMPEP_0113547136 /NCGR_PEP_ID=MMETSP0015_2-20120614/12190_1 /TAXON_ID=2838 /ORGANISM="Odontella" /LENGTH=279 /DNA_ID=CAMNT_0000447661 /DNA_START=106 /DNA_END=945 /DNA_ORIENTATION=- /assembly_acc=CAM_ASM_000160
MPSSDDSSSASSPEDETAQNPHANKRARTNAARGPASAPLEIAPSVTSLDAERKSTESSKKKIIVLLDQARLETVKNKRGEFELLNCDDHRELCKRKLRQDPKEFRPDICHQEMLALLDSPLNKAGCLQVYIRTCKNVLIEINPIVRIPRTFKRFSGVMVQLLHKMKIKASGSSDTLMKVIKNPFSQHLPAGTRVYGMSCQGTLFSPNALASELVPQDPSAASGSPPVCFIIGAMAAGHVTVEDHPYIEKMFSVSEYPLSGAAAISRILGGVENHWGIV